MARLRRFARAGPRAAPFARGLAPWQAKRARAILEAGPGRAITLEQLAGEVGLSPFHFARGFKAPAGVSPHRYQVQPRIARAALLAATNMCAGAIAAEAGYDDPSYFAREAGTTPARHRRERRA
jgi:AraC family transcriptional regulator